MDLYFTYVNGSCDQFMRDPDGTKELVSIVVAPLRVEGIETEKLKVITGCNMWQGCKNPDCFYSSQARNKPKVITNPKKC
jgi:hypothetical protein